MTTERLRIDPMVPDDWRDILEAFTDFESSGYRNFECPLPTGEEETRELISAWAETGGFFSVRLKDTGEVIGYLCRHGDEVPDIGYMFRSRYHGKGYASEALSAWIKAAGWREVTAGTALENLPSVRLLGRLGFELTATETLSFREDAEGNPISFTGGVFVYRQPE